MGNFCLYKCFSSLSNLIWHTKRNIVLTLHYKHPTVIGALLATELYTADIKGNIRFLRILYFQSPVVGRRLVNLILVGILRICIRGDGNVCFTVEVLGKPLDLSNKKREFDSLPTGEFCMLLCHLLIFFSELTFSKN